MSEFQLKIESRNKKIPIKDNKIETNKWKNKK